MYMNKKHVKKICIKKYTYTCVHVCSMILDPLRESVHM